MLEVFIAAFLKGSIPYKHMIGSELSFSEDKYVLLILSLILPKILQTDIMGFNLDVDLNLDAYRKTIFLQLVLFLYITVSKIF